MKKLCLIMLMIVLTAISAFASTLYLGEKLTLNEVTKMSEINANPSKYLGKRVLVEGLVIEVCSTRGCWMDLASDVPFQKMQIKVVDGVIVFPMEAKGRTAKVEGIVEVLDYNLEETIEYYEHKASEKGQKFDPSSVTEPLKIYRIRGLGAEIR
ncbi:MAG: DUF4920 domain-containing protein [Denitrovibrio sp.]|nr:MAG: DUF4920 domain-containing protein [Denitrovibrio sp.]